MNDAGNIAGIVTQADIVRLFAKNVKTFELAKHTVKELRFGYWYA